MLKLRNLVCFLMTTKKHTDRQDNILRSWGRNVEQYFYSEHHDPDRKVIKVSDENDLVKKQSAIFWHIKKYFYDNYEWYFFGDDDTFVNTRLLLTDINKFSRDKVNGMTCLGWGWMPYPAGGAGFLINREIMPRFLDFTLYSDQVCSDVCVGINMRKVGVEMNHIDSFNQFRISDRPIADCYKYYTYHYVYKEMEEMERICADLL